MEEEEYIFHLVTEDGLGRNYFKQPQKDTMEQLSLGTTLLTKKLLDEILESLSKKPVTKEKTWLFNIVLARSDEWF